MVPLGDVLRPGVYLPGGLQRNFRYNGNANRFVHIKNLPASARKSLRPVVESDLLYIVYPSNHMFITESCLELLPRFRHRVPAHFLSRFLYFAASPSGQKAQPLSFGCSEVISKIRSGTTRGPGFANPAVALTPCLWRPKAAAPCGGREDCSDYRRFLRHRRGHRSARSSGCRGLAGSLQQGKAPSACGIHCPASGKAMAYPADLYRVAEVPALIETLQATHSRIDIVLCNAEKSIRRSITAPFRRDDLERSFAHNFLSA